MTRSVRSTRLSPGRTSSLFAFIFCLIACGVLGAIAEAASAMDRTVIGHSVRGRPIIATLKGPPNAAERVLVIGCVHGTEPAGIRVAQRLIESGPVPKAALWIVPSLNPDGVAAGTRGNAHGVDLNRNFPFDWEPLVGLEYSGPKPLSEPESRLARRLIGEVRPDIAIWLHQPFGVIDRSGGDPAIERRFAELVGLPLARLERPPGSASSWQNHAQPRSTAFVVELPALVSGALVRRAASAIRTLTSELARLKVGDAIVAIPNR